MKFKFGQSNRVIEAAKATQFDVVQDNRTKQVTILEYESRIGGMRQIFFLNGVEAILNERGRYVQAKSVKADCAVLVPDEVPEEQTDVQKAA